VRVPLVFDIQRTPSVSDINPKIPVIFDTVIRRMVAADVKQRYASIGHVIKDLKKIIHPQFWWIP
jgi:hypothetical protein